MRSLTTEHGALHTSGKFSFLEWSSRSTYRGTKCRSSAAISANRRQRDWLE